MIVWILFVDEINEPVSQNSCYLYWFEWISKMVESYDMITIL